MFFHHWTCLPLQYCRFEEHFYSCAQPVKQLNYKVCLFSRSVNSICEEQLKGSYLKKKSWNPFLFVAWLMVFLIWKTEGGESWSTVPHIVLINGTPKSLSFRFPLYKWTKIILCRTIMRVYKTFKKSVIQPAFPQTYPYPRKIDVLRHLTEWKTIYLIYLVSKIDQCRSPQLKRSFQVGSIHQWSSRSASLEHPV